MLKCFFFYSFHYFVGNYKFKYIFISLIVIKATGFSVTALWSRWLKINYYTNALCFKYHQAFEFFSHHYASDQCCFLQSTCLRTTVYIYQNSKLLAPVVFFADPVKTSLLALGQSNMYFHLISGTTSKEQNKCTTT